MLPGLHASTLTRGYGMKVVNRAERWIGYRLNILGIRVWERDCQLVAKTRCDKWETIGACRTLPVYIPRTVEELKTAACDSLRMTAYQYVTSQEEADLAEVLRQQKNFDVALRDKVDKFVG
jgi:hypothetical protein